MPYLRAKLEMLRITAESILETEEFEFPAKTVFPNNLMNTNLRVRF